MSLFSANYLAFVSRSDCRLVSGRRPFKLLSLSLCSFQGALSFSCKKRKIKELTVARMRFLSAVRSFSENPPLEPQLWFPFVYSPFLKEK
jgi:hypothetical protein